jgi:hypothetical protein
MSRAKCSIAFAWKATMWRWSEGRSQEFRHRLGASGVIVFRLERLSNEAKADRLAEVIAMPIDWQTISWSLSLRGHASRLLVPNEAGITPLPSAYE